MYLDGGLFSPFLSRAGSRVGVRLGLHMRRAYSVLV